MENSENPMGTNIINNLASLKYFYIAMLRLRSTQEAIKKYLCLAFCSLYLFFAKK